MTKSRMCRTGWRNYTIRIHWRSCEVERRSPLIFRWSLRRGVYWILTRNKQCHDLDVKDYFLDLFPMIFSWKIGPFLSFLFLEVWSIWLIEMTTSSFLVSNCRYPRIDNLECCWRRWRGGSPTCFDGFVLMFHHLWAFYLFILNFHRASSMLGHAKALDIWRMETKLEVWWEIILSFY